MHRIYICQFKIKKVYNGIKSGSIFATLHKAKTEG